MKKIKIICRIVTSLPSGSIISDVPVKTPAELRKHLEGVVIDLSPTAPQIRFIKPTGELMEPWDLVELLAA